MDGYDRAQESPAQRIDRNWEELLQELRVSQTGVQLLTGFLITVPLQPAFHQFDALERGAYVVAISASILATCLLIAPVALHRALFRRRRKQTLVTLGHWLAVSGLAFLAAAIVGVVTLVFVLVFGRTSGLWIGGLAAVIFGGVWLVGPVALRERLGDAPRTPSDGRADGRADRPSDRP